MTKDQIKRLRELAEEPFLPLMSDRQLLRAIADELDKPKDGWEFFCEHANEVPNICPCPLTCGCRYYHCKDKPSTEHCPGYKRSAFGTEPRCKYCGLPERAHR